MRWERKQIKERQYSTASVNPKLIQNPCREAHHGGSQRQCPPHPKIKVAKVPKPKINSSIEALNAGKLVAIWRQSPNLVHGSIATCFILNKIFPEIHWHVDYMILVGNWTSFWNNYNGGLLLILGLGWQKKMREEEGEVRRRKKNLHILWQLLVPNILILLIVLSLHLQNDHVGPLFKI